MFLLDPAFATEPSSVTVPRKRVASNQIQFGTRYVLYLACTTR
jgi:hypothetical protein